MFEHHHKMCSGGRGRGSDNVDPVPCFSSCRQLVFCLALCTCTDHDLESDFHAPFGSKLSPHQISTHVHLSSNMVAEPSRAGRRHATTRWQKTASEIDVQPGGSSPAQSRRTSRSRRHTGTPLSIVLRSGASSPVEPEANEQQAASAREVVIKVEDELQKFRHGILALMDKNLVSSATTEESKMSYYAMVGDYYRYLAELAAVEAKSKAAKDACEADTEATKIAEKFIDKDVPVVLQRQVPMIQHVHRCSTMTRSSVCLLWRNDVFPPFKPHRRLRKRRKPNSWIQWWMSLSLCKDRYQCRRPRQKS